MDLFNSAPNLPATVPIDPNAQALITAQGQRANQPLDTFQSQAAQSIDQGKTLGQSDQSVKQQAASSASDPAMLAAIRNTYQQSADQSLGQLKAKSDVNAALYKGDLLNRQAKMQLSLEGAKFNQNQFLASAYAQTEQARASFVNTLFQTFNYSYGAYQGSHRRNNNGNVNINQPQSSATNGIQGPQTPPTPQYHLGDYNFGQ